MPLKHQILLAKLKKPICIGLFHNDGLCTDAAVRDADKMREKLNEAGINFAAVNYEPPIRIFIEEKDLIMLEISGINPVCVDAR